MKLAIFDLDNTLIGGDSDYLWGEFLCEHGYINVKNHRDEHKRYYEDYKNGVLDINRFLEFQLKPLADNDLATLHAWRDRYLDEKIKSIILDKAISLVDDHRQQDHQLLIITATNRFLTEPIAELFEIEHLIASDAEMKEGKYTGKPIGVPSYAEGKVTRLNAWLQEQGNTYDESWFYSDSHNDIPLLEHVTHPIVVDPDEILQVHAEKQAWPIISLR